MLSTFSCKVLRTLRGGARFCICSVLPWQSCITVMPLTVIFICKYLNKTYAPTKKLAAVPWPLCLCAGRMLVISSTAIPPVTVAATKTASRLFRLFCAWCIVSCCSCLWTVEYGRSLPGRSTRVGSLYRSLMQPKTSQVQRFCFALFIGVNGSTMCSHGSNNIRVSSWIFESWLFSPFNTPLPRSLRSTFSVGIDHIYRI